MHNIYPNKNLYFTEQYVAGPGNFASDLEWHMKNLIIGAPRNWSRNVLEWVLASDQKLWTAYTQGGCGNCQGAYTVNGTTVTRQYVLLYNCPCRKICPARFDPRVKARILSAICKNVAFMTTDGKKVLVVLERPGSSAQTFTVQFKDMNFSTTLNGGAVAARIFG